MDDGARRAQVSVPDQPSRYADSADFMAHSVRRYSRVATAFPKLKQEVSNATTKNRTLTLTVDAGETLTLPQFDMLFRTPRAVMHAETLTLHACTVQNAESFNACGNPNFVQACTVQNAESFDVCRNPNLASLHPTQKLDERQEARTEEEEAGAAGGEKP